MAPCEVSATVRATPATIWSSCFEPMKWESWDPDLRELKDVSGPCDSGTTCTFAMNNGQDIPAELIDVRKNECLTFRGKAFFGTVKFEGNVLYRKIPNEEAISRIDYTFRLHGMLGGAVNLFQRDEVVHGTQGGLDNMVRLSEEAQRLN
ncbi:hypothetical protein THAOC_21494 [Thalassiosira oceanica]|uniref:Polyketide cyclase/dehydrase n=1 Tax=Thalassiosira oceanica TaxID=159749 RepID=K0RX81_THAOC|nr:hypothetical protein THAOC_21494 [Thalassiosira oceanica]|eukprot:EJK58388.1 hypothetical protein THAOC_21494 [Thalassiosira oceanica]